MCFHLSRCWCFFGIFFCLAYYCPFCAWLVILQLCSVCWPSTERTLRSLKYKCSLKPFRFVFFFSFSFSFSSVYWMFRKFVLLFNLHLFRLFFVLLLSLHFFLSFSRLFIQFPHTFHLLHLLQLLPSSSISHSVQMHNHWTVNHFDSRTRNPNCSLNICHHRQ